MQEDAGLLSLLNQAKYLFLRHISEPEENSCERCVKHRGRGDYVNGTDGRAGRSG
jgi:hypothetical protein